MRLFSAAKRTPATSRIYKLGYQTANAATRRGMKSRRGWLFRLRWPLPDDGGASGLVAKSAVRIPVALATYHSASLNHLAFLLSMKQFFLFLLCFALATTGFAQPLQSDILLLGTFHFNNPGADCTTPQKLDSLAGLVK